MKINVVFDPEEDAPICFDLEDLSKAEQSDRVKQWARLGRFVMSLAKVTPSKEALNDYLHDFSKEMEELKDVINDHRSMFSSISVAEKGQLGEAFVRTSLANTFKNIGDTFEIWSKTGHQGDIIGEMSRKDKPPFKVLIEVKDYPDSPRVSSNEIEKFWNDMKSNPDMNAGIFVSINNSKIATIEAAPILMEVYDDRPVIYIAQEEASQKMFLVAWGMLAEILGRGEFDICTDLTKLTRQAAHRLRDAIDTFNSEISSNTSRLDSMIKSAQSIQSNGRQIENEAEKLKNEMIVRAKSLRIEIEREAEALELGSEPNPIPIFSSESVWKAKWEERDASFESRKHGANLMLLLKWLNGYSDIKPNWTETGLEIKKEDGTLITVKVSKGAVQLYYPDELVQNHSLKDDEDFEGYSEHRGKFRIDCRNGVNPTIDVRLLKVLG